MKSCPNTNYSCESVRVIPLTINYIIDRLATSHQGQKFKKVVRAWRQPALLLYPLEE